MKEVGLVVENQSTSSIVHGLAAGTVVSVSFASFIIGSALTAAVCMIRKHLGQ